MIQLKRVYENWEKDDGFRILVDRLWPRGISKEKAHIDVWLKEIAPSTELRKWFHHDPTRWDEFKEKYKMELQEKGKLLNLLKELKEKHTKLTLVYGAKDPEHNQAVVLASYLDEEYFMKK